MPGNETLYGLMLGCAIFMASFVLFVGLIPGEAYFPFKEYEEYYIREDLQGSEMNIYNQTDSFTIDPNSWEERTLDGLTVRFHWARVGDHNRFWVTHVERKILGVVIFSHGIRLDGEYDEIYPEDLYHYYNNASDSSQVRLLCEHMTLDINFASNDTEYTLFEMLWDDNGVIVLDVDYELDLTVMGANIWNILADILTFQSIKTDVYTLDLILNVCVSLPTLLGMAYVFYRLIAGIIPTLSGGGGV